MKVEPGSANLEDVFRRTLDVFGPERILFGTDSTTFPRGFRADIYRAQSAALERIGVTTGARNLIFGENLARILQLRP
jgi:predicted TIM-barrel fold metal-dependent hydrolase